MGPNITHINGSDQDVHAVRFDWQPLPHDTEIFNSASLTGYNLRIVPVTHNLDTCKEKIIPVYIPENSVTANFDRECNPMQSFTLYISAMNSLGNGKENEYCFTLGRTVPGAISLLHVTNGKPLTYDMTSVSITIGNIPFPNENTVVTHYEILLESVDWQDDMRHVNITIDHTKEDLEYWEGLKENPINCSFIRYPVPSSKIIENFTIPVAYFTNYSISGRACSAEGCSMGSLQTSIKTAEHTPLCPPSNISLFNTSSTTLGVTFETPSHYCLSGILKHHGLILLETTNYTQLMRKNASIDEMRNVSIFKTTIKTHFTFSGLHEYIDYTFITYAENGAGVGVISNPVSATTEEDVPDGPPLHCSVFSYNSTTLTVKIGKPALLLQNGIFHYKISIENEYNEMILRRVDVDGEFTTVTFTNLSKFTNHSISICAATKFGDGPLTFLMVKTLEDVPTAPPVDFQTVVITNDSISLAWQDIPNLQKNGILIHYKLKKYGTLHNGSYDSFFYMTSHFNISVPVFPGTTYEFEISGCTIVGCGVEQSAIESRSLEMVPLGTVKNVIASDVKPNSMVISWTPVSPMKRRGNITHYKMIVQNLLHQWQTEDNVTKKDFTTDELNFRLNNLDNYTYYKINITAHTAIGAGPLAEYVFRTAENVPSHVPLNVTAFDTSSSSLNISWFPIDIKHHEGVLLGYNISYNVSKNFTDLRNGSFWGYFDWNNTESTTCEIKGLSLATPYDIQISGYTSFGSGLWSKVITVFTGEFVDGNWTTWTEWGSCSRSCGLGKLMRQRWCTNPIPEAGGNECPGSKFEFKDCNNFTCAGYYLGEPGKSCSTTCNNLGELFACAFLMPKNSKSNFEEVFDAPDYTKLLTISCVDSKNPTYMLATDPSYDVKEGACRGYGNVTNSFDCKAVPGKDTRRLCRCVDPESMQYSDWANWSPCQKSCGGGRQSRFRVCLLDGGCDGKNMDENDCNTQPCPIDGNWGEWSELGNCTKTCGMGDEIRKRFCDNPAPKYNGKICIGTDVEILTGCNPNPCPIHGGWSDWAKFSECIHSCGNDSKQISIRYCNNSVPKYGGDDCIGPNNRTRPCSENQPCQPADITYTARYIEEEWIIPMYKLNHEKSVNLTRRIEQKVHEVYTNSQLHNNTKKISIKFVSMRRGSVIVTFSITHESGVPSAESLILQHDLETGLKNTMPVELLDIYPSNLPTKPPENITAQSLTPFSIDLSWNSLNRSNLQGAFYLVQVYYRKMSVGRSWDNFGTKGTSLTLVDLTPGTWYELRVLASNRGGNGISSPLIQIQTIEGVPSVKPPGASYLIIDFKTVYFAWDPILSPDIPGTLRGYRIQFRKYSENNFEEETVDPTMTQRTVKRFKPFTWYWVELAGYTNAGVGPNEVFVFKTPPGAPGVSPPNATVHDLFSTTEILITWDPIPAEEENGYVKGYLLSYRKYQQGGIDLIGEQFINFVYDRFTFQSRLTGLESYTQYEVHLQGYSAYGDGPTVVLYGGTCKCPKVLYSNWNEVKPYTINPPNNPNAANGLFPELLNMVVKEVCTDCSTYTPKLLYDQTFNGRPSLKLNADDVMKYIDDGVQLSFPIFGQFVLTRFQGELPYIGFVPSQGSAMMVYRPKIKTVGLGVVLKAVVNAWPLILVSVLLAALSGWMLWFLEQNETRADITRESIYGAYEGFWLSFITMTTLGYGDYVPWSFRAKIFMVLWILIGLIVVSLFGGAVSSGMSVGSMDAEYKLYGSKVAAIKGSFEETIAIRRNAIVDDLANYTGVLDVLKAVSERSVDIGLIDATMIQGYVNETAEMSLSVYKILDLNSGYGVVLSGEFTRIENDMRSFITSNQAQIIKFIEKKVGTVTPNLVEIEELLFTPEESKSMLTTLTIIYAIMAVIGILYWLIKAKCRSSNRKISPEDTSLQEYNDFCEFKDIFHQFDSNFEETVLSITEKHTEERFELHRLRENTKKFLMRRGINPAKYLKK